MKGSPRQHPGKRRGEKQAERLPPSNSAWDKEIMGTAAKPFRLIMRGRRWRAAGVMLAVAVLMALRPSTAHAGWFKDLWLTPDQQAQRMLNGGEFKEAANHFTDPMHRGVALFRAGEFKAAGAEFGRVDTPDGAFNRGNALVMQGKYEDAIAAYDIALAGNPEMKAAEENRAIAEIRAKNMERPEGDQGGPTEVGADEIVFDESGKSSEGDEYQVESEQALSQEEIQEMWLRRVQTKPADFLRSKFSYQFARQGGELMPNDETPNDK